MKSLRTELSDEITLKKSLNHDNYTSPIQTLCDLYLKQRILLQRICIVRVKNRIINSFIRNFYKCLQKSIQIRSCDSLGTYTEEKVKGV